jgi:hypothetical protein
MHPYPDVSTRLASPLQWPHEWSDWADGDSDLLRRLDRFEPIRLAQMEGVALLDRTDTKYVMNTHQLEGALAALGEHYWVLDIDGLRLSSYQTLYFDTADFALYMRHHAGRQSRYKVRSRRYVATDKAFVEVKLKTSQNRTIKRRLETHGLAAWLTPELRSFVGAQVALGPALLQPRLANDFSRITLVSKYGRERVTVDLKLQFSNGPQTAALPRIVIAEVKQDGLNRHSPFMRQMRAAAVRPTGFSKYCIGVARLYPAVKHNNFKPTLRLVEELLRGNNHVQRTH